MYIFQWKLLDVALWEMYVSKKGPYSTYVIISLLDLSPFRGSKFNFT